MDVAAFIIAIVAALTGGYALVQAREANRIAKQANAIAEEGVDVQREAVGAERERLAAKLEIDNVPAMTGSGGAEVICQVWNRGGSAARRVEATLLFADREWARSTTGTPPTVEVGHMERFKFGVERGTLEGPTGTEAPRECVVIVRYSDDLGDHENVRLPYFRAD